ncbi:MAG: pyridoxine 5'-phosphate synthase [Pirellulaceae bacterium]|nr:pyridoxine 5'-phosphate synthase [Pirellulaceae bacterium]
MAQLGVNIDHVATIRQARRTYEPDPVLAAGLAEQAGADLITVHLREDRRHIQDRDLRLLRETVATRLTLELACDSEVVDIACQVKPHQATLVPERREEVTTEGGLDVVADPERVKRAVEQLRQCGIEVSLFIDPDQRQIEASRAIGVTMIELHTGSYALARGRAQQDELARLIEAGKLCCEAGMQLHAGHGLNYHNVGAVAAIDHMDELNIGHSIIARAVFVGISQAVADMKRLIVEATSFSTRVER